MNRIMKRFSLLPHIPNFPIHLFKWIKAFSLFCYSCMACSLPCRAWIRICAQNLLFTMQPQIAVKMKYTILSRSVKLNWNWFILLIELLAVQPRYWRITAAVHLLSAHLFSTPYFYKAPRILLSLLLKAAIFSIFTPHTISGKAVSH